MAASNRTAFDLLISSQRNVFLFLTLFTDAETLSYDSMRNL
jgi:hypothetical protein